VLLVIGKNKKQMNPHDLKRKAQRRGSRGIGSSLPALRIGK
jgi:hypothetical protein